MTYTNLPPTLYEMFGALEDRIRKLETGPSLAYTTGYDALQQAQGAQGGAVNAYAQAIIAQAQAAAANLQALTAQSTASNALTQAITAQATAAAANVQALTAYSTATVAQVQAINATAQAVIAQSQATVAQSTATFAQSLAYSAQSTAVIANTTANGKNKVTYSLSTPGTTANTAGDIWFQYSGSGLVIGQYVGLGGTSWQQQTVTQAVIGTLDAGKITTGTLSAITIDAGTGGTAFHVTAAGYMSAQGAYIKGNITADSGTFNGTVNASSGLFGNVAGGNYWSIGATGLTAVGSGTITGGLIQGSSIAVPQASPKFQVDNAGNMTATSASIQGSLWSSNGYFGTAPNYWSIGSSGLTGVGSATITGGLIQGSSIAVPAASPKFAVDNAGNMQASSASIQGTIWAKTGYIGDPAGGNVWAIYPTGIQSSGSAYIYAGSITAATITNGSTFSVSPSGYLTASSGLIGGWTLGSTTISATSGTKTTSLDASTAQLSLSDSSTGFLTNGITIAASGSTSYFSASGMYINNKLAVDTMNELGSVAATPRLYAPANVGIRIVPNASFSSQTYPVSVEGALSVTGTMYNAGIASGTGTGLVYVTGSFRIAYTTSSERFKTDITEIDATNILDKIDQMRPITFRISEDFAIEGEENPLTVGFLAEDVADIGGFEGAINYDPLGDPFSIAYDRLAVFLAMGIKELNKRVKALEGNNG